ncbi:MAG: hypothetical protein A2X46_18110 [Lentisphaerae bacterium GWF2_57_35]|nr:MAG: hypothetical protein A2X46_18110 [Lentisphaerae bacterium GWF2_57_35]
MQIGLRFMLGAAAVGTVLMAPEAWSDFSLYEGGASQVAMGEEATGQADRPSALFYNPAGITQLKGVQVEAGCLFARPSAKLVLSTPEGDVSAKTEDSVFPVPNAYATMQINDRFWSGVGIYSRFGLGTEYPSDWPGRYSFYSGVIRSMNVNPNVAFKVTEELSVAVGATAMWFDMEQKQKVLDPFGGPDMELTLKGESWGYGYNVAGHYRLHEKAALGLSYQSRIKQHVRGKAEIDYGSTDAESELELPDFLFAGISLAPADRWTVNLGAVYTGWKSYDQVVVALDDPELLGTDKRTVRTDWENVWRYQLGVEYAVTDRLSLRGGYIYDPSPVPEDTADYSLPLYNRNIYTVGAGYAWDRLTLDVYYIYLDSQDRSFDGRLEEGIYPTRIEGSYSQSVGFSVTALF